jgi:hypothetical protein
MSNFISFGSVDRRDETKGGMKRASHKKSISGGNVNPRFSPVKREKTPPPKVKIHPSKGGIYTQIPLAKNK